MANKDSKAPGFIDVIFKDENGRVWGKVTANAKTFSSGSKGFYGNGKIINPENSEAKYQVGCNITLVGSKPDSK